MQATENQTPSQLTDQLARRKWHLAVLVVIVTACLAVPAARLSFDQTIESFFADSSAVLKGYQQSKQTFGGDEFLIVGYAVDDPTNVETLVEMEEFSDQLAKIPGIRSESMQDLAAILRNDRAPGWMRVAMRLPTFQRSILRESRRMLVSDDDKTVAILMRLEDSATAPLPREETFRQVRETAAQHDPPAVVAGEPLQVFDMFQYVEEDAATLGIASSALLMFVILVMFRNIRWVLLPILIIHVTLIWTKGTLSLSNMKLSMVSSMLTSLVTIIGVATLMHITVTFRELRVHHDRETTFRLTFDRLWGPVLLTCLTTALGFAALLLSQIVPVRSFALMMTFATLLIPVLCLLTLPIGILSGKTHADPAPPLGEAQLVRILQRFCRMAIHHPKTVLSVTAVLAMLVSSGLVHLQVETDFSKNFRPESQIAQAIDYFETRMGGVGSWEVGFAAPDNLTDEYLDEVRALSQELRELKLSDGTQMTKVISLTDGLDLVPKIPIDASGRGGLIPVIRRLRETTLEEKREFIGTLQPEMEPSLYDAQAKRMRIMLRSLERQPAETKLKLISEVERISQKYFPDAAATGLYVLLANMISSLLGDQLVSFIAALLGILAMMTITFRSWKIGIISMIPNVLPILVVIGTMGLLKQPLNIGTAMIASVSMGLTIDSTIHYLWTYLRLRKAGSDHQQATEIAHSNVGLALVLANIALVIGFSVLTMSHFVPLADFGILVCIAMVGGLLSNIFLMPVLLRWVNVPTPQATSINVAQ